MYCGGRKLFEITADNLHRQAEIKTLKLCSDSYKICLYYYGDYEADRKADGKCRAADLSMVCKPSGRALPLTLAAGKLRIQIGDMAYPDSIGLNQMQKFLKEMEEYKKQVEAAFIAAQELAEIIKQYFGLDVSAGE